MNEDSNLKPPTGTGTALSGARLVTSAGMWDYWEMTKPRLTFLVLVTTFVGYCVGSQDGMDWIQLVHTIVGTALVAGGAAVLNQFVERDLDARMKRTEDRPMPAGRIQPKEGLIYGILLSVAGGIYLFLIVDWLPAFLSIASWASYLFVYTPLKTRTPLCTIIGAVPGAIPPMIGWTAATHSLGAGAWVLFAILFLWQMPHFYALSHMYQEDYSRGGFPMLSVCGPHGDRTSLEIKGYTLALIPVSLLPAFLGMNTLVYLIGAILLSVAFLVFGWKAATLRNVDSSRRLFFASIFYLPFLLTLVVATKGSL